jgi:Xaa-Pro aminopeptidase
MTAWNAIVEALKIVERLAKPDVRCRDIFQEVFDHLLKSPVGRFPHHLGHGVGLQPHEYPHLNPKWDDVLMEGEIFTAEPGLYSPAINGGIRLENIYRVTATGVENLITAPLELV